jgi:hypothetical protein
MARPPVLFCTVPGESLTLLPTGVEVLLLNYRLADGRETQHARRPDYHQQPWNNDSIRFAQTAIRRLRTAE